jgi:hypothetical protein
MSSTAAVSRRPLISVSTSVARARDCTYAAKCGAFVPRSRALHTHLVRRVLVVVQRGAERLVVR